MPAGRKAPTIVQPRGLPVEKVRTEIGEKIVAMDVIIAQCEARFGRHVKLLDHPILKQLRQLRESATGQMGLTQTSEVFSSK
jgi:hypothetical protein